MKETDAHTHQHFFHVLLITETSPGTTGEVEGRGLHTGINSRRSKVGTAGGHLRGWLPEVSDISINIS